MLCQQVRDDWQGKSGTLHATSQGVGGVRVSAREVTEKLRVSGAGLGQ